MFGRLFNLDNPFWIALGRLADIVMLNMYFVITAWPIVTAGASFAALYETMWRVEDERGGGVTRMYFTSFKENFWRATALWAVVGPLGIALVCSWIFLPEPELNVIKTVCSLVYLLIFPFVFYLQVRFENTYRNTLKNAVLMPLSQLPWAFAALVVTVGLLALTIAVAIYQPFWLPPLALGGVALLVYATIPLLNRTLKPWLDPKDANEAQNEADSETKHTVISRPPAN